METIIFDLGGVLLDIDYARTENAFKELGYGNFETMYSQYNADDLFAGFEKGLVSEEDFYAAMLRGGKPGVTRSEVFKAWTAMLLRWRVSSFDFLESISKKYRLFLLSNTNVIHCREFNVLWNEERNGRKPIDDYFEKAYYSHLIGYRKPNKDVFEFIIRDAGIEPKETLFIDDSYNNLEPAAALGFKTYLLKGGERIENLDY